MKKLFKRSSLACLNVCKLHVVGDVITQVVKPGFSFWLFFFSSFSHKSPSGLYSACVGNDAYDRWNLQKLLSLKATSSDFIRHRIF